MEGIDSNLSKRVYIELKTRNTACLSIDIVAPCGLFSGLDVVVAAEILVQSIAIFEP